MAPDTNTSIFEKNDARKLFKKLGACSQTFTYILNREFGHPNKEMERATDPLAGGILAKGHQCGMLWGASLAIGAEAYRRFDDRNQAIAVAIKATQMVMQSYKERESTVNCEDVTKCDWSSRWSRMKYFMSGRFLHCFKLADLWAPEAVNAATEGLSSGDLVSVKNSISCASLVAEKMGATDEEIVMVAGFAGGLGLSGNGCGALSAAIWMNTLLFYRDYTGKPQFINPKAEKAFEAFEAVTEGKILCHEICGTRFNSMTDHTDYIANGGCSDLIHALSTS